MMRNKQYRVYTLVVCDYSQVTSPCSYISIYALPTGLRLLLHIITSLSITWEILDEIFTNTVKASSYEAHTLSYLVENPTVGHAIG